MAVTATVGIVAGGAVTFVATRNSRPDRVATAQPVSTQPAVLPSSIPTTEQPMPPVVAPPRSDDVGCGVNLAAPQVLAAVNQLPPYPGTGWAWSTNPSTFEGNFNPCATLSTVLVMPEMATGSSPVTALMFHDGDYLGTATSKAYGFTTLDSVRTTDDTVVLSYKTPGVCNACPPAGVTNVRYQWQNDHVEMLDPPPPSIGAAPTATVNSVHNVETTIEWTGPQQGIEFNYAPFTDRRHIVVGKVNGNQRVGLVDGGVRRGDYYGADPIIGGNSYISCRVSVDGVEVLRDDAYAGDGHDCNCLRVMP